MGYQEWRKAKNLCGWCRSSKPLPKTGDMEYQGDGEWFEVRVCSHCGIPNYFEVPSEPQEPELSYCPICGRQSEGLVDVINMSDEADQHESWACQHSGEEWAAWSKTL
jgi:hypothetical protein